MNHLLSDRIKKVPESFIRKILKVSIQSDIISFAGGHPNADLFPVDGLQAACAKLFEKDAKSSLQYASTEGDKSLREWIVNRYKAKQGLTVSADNILITNGSQQALDLLGKVLINKGDAIAVENPGYLGAIQAFSVYQPNMLPVSVGEAGMDVDQLSSVLAEHPIKLIYTVPNFQNPTGISYTQENREKIAQLVSQYDTLLVQDDPYGELRFRGEDKSNFYSLLEQQTILLGSFSKVVIPSFRLGWMVVPDALVKPLVIAKQAADLHTNYFSQRVMAEYLSAYSLDDHIQKIRIFYGQQKKVMMEAIQQYFPADVAVTDPEGGMFLWVSLPSHLSAMDLFESAIKKGVAFVPGEPFYIDSSSIKKASNTLRLSYVTVDKENIIEGIKRLGGCIHALKVCAEQ